MVESAQTLEPDRSGLYLGSSPSPCMILGNLFIFLECQLSLLVFNNLEQGHCEARCELVFNEKLPTASLYS